MSRWSRYWFADGGRLALAVVRIAVAVSVLLVLGRIAALPDALVAPREVYRPVGVWRLWGGSPPPAVLVTALWYVAWGATASMLVGAWSRASTAISAASAIALASLVFSGKPTWSHQYNVVLITQLALIGGHCGDALSIDALVRRVRGRAPLLDSGYQWSVRLAQLAVALMFVGAAFHKIAQGHFTLRWALSDSLRNHLLVRFDLAGLERPPVAAWLVDDVWRYRGAALLNLVSQLAPLAAIVFVRRPWVRAIAGLAFAVEVIALGLVVDLWNEDWLPLYAVFVDWDRLVGWIRRRPRVVEIAGPPPTRAVKAFVIAFVAYDVLCSFVPTFGARMNTYPWSSFPMFSQIRANPPYGEHVAYGVPGDRFEAITDKEIPPYVSYFLDHVNRGAYTAGSSRELRARLSAILSTGQTRYPYMEWQGLRHRLSLFVAPPYPAPAHLEEHAIAITGELRTDGTFRSVLGTIHDGTLALAPVGVELPDSIRFVYYADDMPEPHDLAATRTGPTTWTLPVTFDADPVYIVAIVDSTPWLAASRRSWKWGR